MLLKRTIGLLLCTTLMLLLVSCGNKEISEENAIVIDKDASITQYIVDNAPLSGVDETSLAEFSDTYLSETVASFNSESGNENEAITIEEKSVSKEKLKVVLKYRDAAAYASFNNVVCYNGNIEDAIASGYDFGRVFYAYDKTPVSKQQLLTECAGKNVLILNEPQKVELPSQLIAMSSGVNVDSEGVIRVASNPDETLPKDLQTTTKEPIILIYDTVR